MFVHVKAVPEQRSTAVIKRLRRREQRAERRRLRDELRGHILRESIKHDYSEIARRLGVTASAIGHIVAQDETSIPSAERMAQMIEALAFAGRRA